MSTQSVINMTRHYLDQASEYYGQKFEVSEIRFDLSGKTAGYFKQFADGSCLINYNRQILQSQPGSFIDRTVPHEVAHKVAYQLYGSRIRPHGAEWKSVMALFNADDSRCHNYEVSHLKHRQYRKFLYHCDCQSHTLTSIRHNRIIRGQQYFCKNCGQPLAYQAAL